MSAVNFHRELSEFVELLSANDLLLAPNSHKIVNLANGLRLVTWNSVQSEWSPAQYGETSLSEYLEIIRGREFSALLLDGAILQVSYLFRGAHVRRHRATYIPCPIHFDADELRTPDGDFLPVEDFLDILGETELRTRTRTRPTFRFEFDPENAGENHPSSHLHMGKSQCRVPVKAPLKLAQFSRFVFKNLYPEEFASIANWQGPPPEGFEATISELERSELHIAF